MLFFFALQRHGETNRKEVIKGREQRVDTQQQTRKNEVQSGKWI